MIAAAPFPPLNRAVAFRIAQSRTDSARLIVAAAAIFFFGATSWVSYAHWANFEYRTFDLAYYVQGLWQLIHGRFSVSVEDVPLLGNHVEPIIFLFAPLFVFFQHPMLFVVVQNALLAGMGPVAYDIGHRLGLSKKDACFLALALLLAPVSSYVALHEFHPEALAAPFLLFMYRAQLAGGLRRYWIWFLAALACKENIALLLIAYAVVRAIAERKRGLAYLKTWYLSQGILALAWLCVAIFVITPSLNGGQIDYLGLYSRLGSSPSNIVGHLITQPGLALSALIQSLTNGNLVWGLLLPFLCLPLLRFRWLIVAAPVLLQHLLSWRSSEWTIYFHYGAPLLALFWIATAEAAVRIRQFLPVAVLVACGTSQVILGPGPEMVRTAITWPAHESDREIKQAFIKRIDDNASIVAPFPYLTHLATRERLYSLHYILKGLKTLSRTNYVPPPPTDFVLIDLKDESTFDKAAGYYHPEMKTIDGRVILSSDQLLANFLNRATWSATSSQGITLLVQDKSHSAERK